MVTKNNTTTEIKQNLRKSKYAVVPIGSTEQQGPHLPIYADSIITYAFAEGIARAFNAFLVPLLPYSNSSEHKGFAGTISLTTKTLMGREKEKSSKTHRTGERP